MRNEAIICVHENSETHRASFLPESVAFSKIMFRVRIAEKERERTRRAVHTPPRVFTTHVHAFTRGNGVANEAPGSRDFPKRFSQDRIFQAD